MMSKAEIKRQLEELETKRDKLKNDFSDNEKWVNDKKEIIDLKETIRKKENDFYYFQEKLRSEKQSEIDLVISDIKSLQKNLDEADRGLNTRDYNLNLQRMFHEFNAGTTAYRHTRLIWVSDDGKFAIFKQKAFAGYGGRSYGVGNTEAAWFLYRIVEKFNAQDLRVPSAKAEFCLWSKEGGRWSKKDMIEAMNVLKNL